MLETLIEESEALPAWLVEQGLFSPASSRRGPKVDNPIVAAAVLAITLLDRHGIPRVCSDDGVTAKVLGTLLGAVDIMRGQKKPEEREEKEPTAPQRAHQGVVAKS